MNENKVFLQVYSVLTFAVGVLLLISGIFLILNNLPNEQNEIVYFGLNLTVGVAECFIGLITTIFGLKSTLTLLLKKEKDEQNNIRRPNMFRPSQIASLFYMVAFFSIFIFTINYVCDVFGNDQIEKIYYIVFYYIGLFVAIIVGGITSFILGVLKISKVKKEKIKEFRSIIPSVYCLILNIIYPINTLSLVAFIALLVIIAIRLVQIITYLILAKPPIEEVVSSDGDSEDSKTHRFYERFIKSDKGKEEKDKDDYSI